MPAEGKPTFSKGAVVIVGGPTLSLAHPTPRVPQHDHTACAVYIYAPDTGSKDAEKLELQSAIVCPL